MSRTEQEGLAYLFRLRMTANVRYRWLRRVFNLTRGEGGVRAAAARPGGSGLLLSRGVARGPIAEAKISRKIVAGQPYLSRFGETLAQLPPTGD